MAWKVKTEKLLLVIESNADDLPIKLKQGSDF